MSARQLRLRAASVLLALAAAVGVHIVWYLFVNTATGQAIDRAAFEGALIGQTRWWQIGRPVLDLVSSTLVGLGALAAVVIALIRRRAWLAVQALMVVVGANVSTQLVKDWYNRPRLLAGWTGQNSLPSGHTTVVAAASLALLLTVPRRWRVPVAVIGAVWTLLTGLSTLVGRWHRPADVVAALLVACFWAALAGLVGSERCLDPPLNGPGRSIAITSASFGVIAMGSTFVALGSLVRLYRFGAVPDDGATLTAEILDRGEFTAYVGGIAAVFAAVFGVFAAMLWLRDVTLKRVARPGTHDNSPFDGYGATRTTVRRAERQRGINPVQVYQHGQVATMSMSMSVPLPPEPVTVGRNGVTEGEM